MQQACSILCSTRDPPGTNHPRPAPPFARARPDPRLQPSSRYQDIARAPARARDHRPAPAGQMMWRSRNARLAGEIRAPVKSAHPRDPPPPSNQPVRDLRNFSAHANVLARQLQFGAIFFQNLPPLRRLGADLRGLLQVPVFQRFARSKPPLKNAPRNVHKLKGGRILEAQTRRGSGCLHGAGYWSGPQQTQQHEDRQTDTHTTNRSTDHHHHGHGRGHGRG